MLAPCCSRAARAELYESKGVCVVPTPQQRFILLGPCVCVTGLRGGRTRTGHVSRARGTAGRA
eukprot:701860-Prymnesium_polylepis.1